MGIAPTASRVSACLPARGALPDVKVAARRCHADFPGKIVQSLLERCGVVENLDDAILAAIVEAASRCGGVRAFERMVTGGAGGLVEGIHEEDATRGCEGRTNELPE